MPQATEPKPTPTAPLDNGLGFSEFVKVGRDALTTPKDEKAGPDKAEEQKAAAPAADDQAKTAESEAKADEKPETTDLQKKLETTEKRRKDAERNYQREHREKLDLRKELATVNERLEVLDKKLSGTYEEQAQPTEEQRQREMAIAEEKARMEEKAKISIALAKRDFGEDEIKAKILDEDAPWRKFEDDPATMSRVWAAESPYHEAMRILKEQELYEAYGTQDLTEILKKDREQTKEQLKQEVLAELKGEAPAKESKKTPPTLGTARGGANNEPRSQAQQKPLSAMFPHLS